MNRRHFGKVAASIIVFLFATGLTFNEFPNQTAIEYIMLTWKSENTSDHMRVNFGTPSKIRKAHVFYDTVSRNGDFASYSGHIESTSQSLKGIKNRFHSADLENLKPDTTYYFIVGHPDIGFSSERKFRTLPNDRSQIRFINGGDMGTWDMVELVQRAASHEPHFALIGGDIAYANGRLDKWDRWQKYVRYWTRYMVTPQGYSIPGIFAIGNHETKRARAPKEMAPFYFALLNQQDDELTYFVREIGDNIILHVLDSSHVYSHASQKGWLKHKMSSFKNKKYQFAAYHAPLYPSHRSFNNFFSKRGRKSWLPVFDEMGLTTAFEHHDHVMKQTKLLKNDKVSRDGTGTLYIGDGCFGAGPREAKVERWYIDTAKSEKHFWLVEASEFRITYTAYNRKNEVIHTYTQDFE